MNPFLHWLKSRWRTRGEYAAGGRRLLFRYGGAVAAAVAPLVLGLFALGWILSGPSRSGAREVRIDALADSIVAAVEREGHGPLSSLEDYVAAGILTPDDVEFLADRNITFHPIGRGSPDTAVVFRRASGGVERVHRKDGSEDYYTASTSRDGRFRVVIGPPPRGRTAGADGRMRSVTVRSLEGGRVLASFLVRDHANARWSPDGRFVAIEAGLDDESGVASRETFVLAVGPASVHRMDLPEGVAPEALLAREDRSARFQTTAVRALGWRGSMLEVESAGDGWIGSPGASGSTWVTIRCRFALEVSESGIREIGREMITYAKT